MSEQEPGRDLQGVVLRDGDHRVRLKWHRMKRRIGDVPFTPSILAEALAAGASCEIDLRRHGEHGFLVIHDETLERETTGSGPVRNAGIEGLRGLFMRTPEGAPTAERLLLLDDMARLAEVDAANGALIQLDLKEAADAIDAETAERFAALIAPVAGRFILSGLDFEAVRRLRAAVPELAVGYDPCERGIEGRLHEKSSFESFVAEALAAAPEASTIYLAYPLILRAATLGHDLVGAFHRAGKEIDAYTLNTAEPYADGTLRTLVALKVDQITTDEPIELERRFLAGVRA